MELEINNAFTELLDAENKIAPRLKEVKEEMLAGPVEDKVNQALVGQVRLAARQLESHFRSAGQAVARGRQELGSEIEALQEA